MNNIVKIINQISAVALIIAVMIFVASCEESEKEKEKAPELSITPSYGSINFSADGTTAGINGVTVDPTFTVNTQEATWDAVSNQSWLKVTKQNNSFTLTAEAVDEMTVSNPMATVAVTGYAAKPVFITVTQDADATVYRNITGQVLKNTQEPFEYGTMIAANRWYAATDWTANAAAAANGNVDVHTNTNVAYNNNLTIWTWSGLSPAASITNGKLYQTVALGAGTYRFEAVCHNNGAADWAAYLVAALGSDLPDVDNVTEQTSLASSPIYKVLEHHTGPISGSSLDQTVTVTFVVPQGGATVSLGFVVSTLAPNTQLMIRSVSLYVRD